MATKLTIKFNPAGFAECLQAYEGQVQSAAEGIAARASAMCSEGSGFHVEMSSEPRFKDSAYGVTRPIGRIVSNDDETAREEAENKILSKAVTG